MDTSTKTMTKTRRLSRFFSLCLRRHVFLLVSFAVIALYYALRGNRALMNGLCNYVVYPYHRLMGSVFSVLPISFMELIYTAIGIFVIVILARCVIQIAKGKNRMKTIYSTIISAVCVGVSFFAAYCLLWSTTYYADSFQKKSGLETGLVSAEELSAVTGYFIDVLNEYAPLVERDESGVFCEDENKLFDRAVDIYDNAEQIFPCLEGANLRPKKMYLYSNLMSRMNFTGVFFPITGEANLNIESPACLLPATLAHEIAHQRGVAAENEANFVSILACMESGDPVFTYSAALLAYIHLGNALHDADCEEWSELYYEVGELARIDLADNNAFWEKYETKTAEVSEAIYTGFLQSNGQQLGMKSYGACVDLLVSYYYNK